jgi:cobalt-zinc-cadmium resistance protein CzcA
MIGSLVCALTVVPVLASLLLRGKISEEDSFIVRWLKRGYRPILTFALRRRAVVVGVAVAAFIGSASLVPFLGTEFVPELEEGTLVVRVTMHPSISLDETLRISRRMEQKLVRYPEVTYAVSQIGRPELGGDPESVNNNEISVGLKPQSAWTTAHTRAELVRVLAEDLGEYPGVAISISQPIGNRVDELLSGVKAQIAIKLFGDDLTVLEEKGREIQDAIAGVPGASDLQMEQISGESQLVVQARRADLARYGLNVADVIDVVTTAVGGETVTNTALAVFSFP